MADIDIQSVVFSRDGIEISYVEPEADFDEGTGILMVRTLQIPYEVMEHEFNELAEHLQDMVDRAQTIKRNPPEKFQRRGFTS